METVVKKLYEAMFLVDSAEAASDWDGIVGLIRTILEKSCAEINSLRKWDERKLAYTVQGKSRGTYILCYFRVDGTKVRDIERDILLSERVIRVLILNADEIPQEIIDKDTPAMLAEKRPTVQEVVEAVKAEDDVEEIEQVEKIPDIMEDIDSEKNSNI